jgi:ketosteroid isomerase-like protein
MKVLMNTVIFSRRHFLTRTASSSVALGAAGAMSMLITPAYAKSGTTAAGLSENATPRQVSESYWRAEAERNVDKVGLHYHADAIFMPPGERLVGWDNIRKWYEATYRQFQSVRVDIVHEITNGPEASLEWKATLKDAAGKVITPIGVNIVRVEGGKFREVRAYFDSSILD